MNSKEIRRSFIQYFEDRNHSFIRSSPVVPLDDPTLLFTNAGMNQFKPIFLGEQEPAHSRVVNSQKCIRVSGKHNDLEEVGVDTFHHTFFEMLGNWSFGDYYKAEAIRWAWELFTKVWNMDKRRLWATVYQDDDEAFELWTKITDINPERVLRCSAKDNFWEMGETGPCGPCSEIHYYIGADLSKQDVSGVNVSDQFWELWNLVFIQYNRDEKGTLNELPAMHVDTGAGLERIVSVLQNKTSNYETDLFIPIIREIEKLTEVNCTRNPVPHRVIADHIRMMSFSIADGAMPSNEGRGYVLRRILRRAARFGRILGQREPFIYHLVDTLGEVMGEVYPEILDKRAHIKNVIKAEESSFNDTLDRGLGHFERIIRYLTGKVIPGEEAFRLYDTYGFPLDLTELMAREKGMSVDIETFNNEMKNQKARAKAAGKFRGGSKEVKWNILSRKKHSEFKGYESLETSSSIVRWALSGEGIKIILDQTPFYGESGGQIGDTGTIVNDGIDLQVLKTTKDGDSIIHYCEGDFDERHVKESVTCRVDAERRQAIRLNHTATHLLHTALKRVLGEHIHQAGSLVSPDYLRFDVTHFEKISAVEIAEVEVIVNRQILKNTVLDVTVKPFEQARAAGAEALFGEKYGSEVRVVAISGFSMELCGGTHVDRTGDIGIIKIVEESSLAAGIRRIVAITGITAVRLMQEQGGTIAALQSLLKCPVEKVVERAESLVAHNAKLQRQLKRKSRTGSEVDFATLVKQSSKIKNKYNVVVQKVKAASIEELKEMGDKLLSKLGSGIGVLGATGEKKPTIVVVVTPDLVKKGIKANELAKSLGLLMGGGGGGRPHLATAGGKDNALLKVALEKSFDIISDTLDI